MMSNGRHAESRLSRYVGCWCDPDVDILLVDTQTGLNYGTIPRPLLLSLIDSDERVEKAAVTTEATDSIETAAEVERK
jgi:hypothetical protein